MRYLLDSNVCVDYLNGRFPQVASRVQDLLPDDLCLISIVVAELRFRSLHGHRRRICLLDSVKKESRARTEESAKAL